MSTITPEYIRSLFDPIASEGEWTPFVDAITEDVKWAIAREGDKDLRSAAGLYNKQEWLDLVRAPLIASLDMDKGFTMAVTNFDVIGNKVVAECYGTATQKNGKPYNNKYCWILIFNDERRIVEIREYLDTALVYETRVGNGALDAMGLA
ncbi:hypothetical protein MNV49_007298 [Pseudohyphozyma bogoriensis]|nr:hypothetical protein MNV49_007298 [Pseudohyphozyma bogoriensis]